MLYTRLAFISLACLVGAAPVAQRTTSSDLAARNYAYTFDEYLAEYGKSYFGDEYGMRKAIFAQAMDKIRAHNSGTSSWKMGLSEHTDRTPSEWVQIKGYKRSSAPLSEGTSPLTVTPLRDLPGSIDWREKNVVTPVKDQRACGSCWAFSATETIESNVAIATGTLLTLAPQELVDCVPNPDECGGTGGCEGATQPIAFNWTVNNPMPLESSYPYKGRDGSCQVKQGAAGIKGFERLPTNDYTALMTAVATVGPIAISVDANWMMYEQGVYDDSECGTTIDHAVQLVGYGTDSGVDYWLVRNSWGTSWGEEGYIRIKRFGEGNEPCGTDEHPDQGTGCKGGPSTMKVCGLCGILSDSSYVTGGFVM